VVLTNFYSNHSIRVIIHLTYSLVSPYIVLPLCIIDYHICQDIFDIIDIMYYRLPYVSGTLPLKTLILYIYGTALTSIQSERINK
jgi:hypothetical protein